MSECALLASCGVRHLCTRLCYYAAFEPYRRVVALRAAAEERGAPEDALGGWRAELVPSTSRQAASLPAPGSAGRPASAVRKRQRSPADVQVADRRGAGAEDVAVREGWVFVSPGGGRFSSARAVLRALGCDDATPPRGVGSAHRSAPPQESPLLDAPSSGAGASARRLSPVRLRGLPAGGPAGGVVRRVASRYFAADARSGHRTGASQRGASDGCHFPSSEHALGSLPLAPSPAAPSPPRRATVAWRPPRSPFGLLEELFWDRPWALLLCCILLNQTTRLQVDPVLAKLLAAYPDALALAAAEPGTLEPLLRPLGLHRQRSRSVVAFSRAFAAGGWVRPEELPGVGKYGGDAHAIFCLGRYRETEPQDHALNWYCAWLVGIDYGGR